MRLKAAVIVVVMVVVVGFAPQASARAVQKQRFSQPVKSAYPLTLHVTHSSLSLAGGAAYLHLIGVVNGVKVELVSGPSLAGFDNTGLLHPGDYPARLTGQETKKDGSTIQEYDLQLANGQHEAFTIIGLSE